MGAGSDTLSFAKKCLNDKAIALPKAIYSDLIDVVSNKSYKDLYKWTENLSKLLKSSPNLTSNEELLNLSVRKLWNNVKGTDASLDKATSNYHRAEEIYNDAQAKWNKDWS